MSNQSKPNQSKSKFLDKAFEAVLKEMLKVFIKKNKDYGKDNILETGELGIAFRVNDKVKRLQNLLGSDKAPENESLDESWMDIAVYAVIAILYRKGEFKELELDPEV